MLNLCRKGTQPTPLKGKLTLVAAAGQCGISTVSANEHVPRLQSKSFLGARKMVEW